ncbi:MAG: glycosyltransferase family 4 protein [Bacteroidetes bacterium]|nr:glycosyltransferase family 4 protein [Bacteroidota bacterium]
MHILYVYQFYNSPDCSTTAKHHGFIKYFVDQGHKVSLVSSRTFLDQRITNEFEWLPKGVDATHIHVPYANEMGVARRSIAFADYMVRALAAGLRMEKPDVVFGISTPLTTAWTARQIARIKRVPWVFEVKDLWPLVPIEVGAIGNPLAQRVLFRAERKLYESAAHVISLSPGMTEYIVGTGTPPEKITTIVNGTDFHLIDRPNEARLAALRAKHGLAGKKVVLYGGKFGRMNDIPMLLRAAERLQHRDDIHFVFIGYGFLQPQVDEGAARLTNVSTVPTLPKHQMLEWFRLADLSLVTFINVPSLGTNSPSKLYDSLAGRTPVIVTNPGWTKDLVEREKVGFFVSTGNDAELATAIEQAFANVSELAAMAERGRSLAERDFDRRDHVRRLEAVLQAVVDREPVLARVASVDEQTEAKQKNHRAILMS